MTPRHPRPCLVHGCPELTTDTYCPEHRKDRQQAYDNRRGSPSKRGYDRRWQKVRKGYLRKVGWRCEECGDRPADTSELHVHHRDHDATGPRRFDHNNLTCLCRSCHSRLHASGKGPEPPQPSEPEQGRRGVWGL